MITNVGHLRLPVAAAHAGAAVGVNAERPQRAARGRTTLTPATRPGVLSGWPGGAWAGLGRGVTCLPLAGEGTGHHEIHTARRDAHGRGLHRTCARSPRD